MLSVTQALSNLLFCHPEGVTYLILTKQLLELQPSHLSSKKQERPKRRKDFAYDRKAKSSQKIPAIFQSLARPVLLEQCELQEKLGNDIFSQVLKFSKVLKLS